MEKQAIPARAPVLPTHAMWFFGEMATVLGNSPMVSTGWPIMVSFVGSWEEMVNIDTVLEPGLTANTMFFSTLRADCENSGSGAAVLLLAPSMLEAPLPPARVMEPAERRPFAPTFKATIELPAGSFVRK